MTIPRIAWAILSKGAPARPRQRLRELLADAGRSPSTGSSSAARRHENPVPTFRDFETCARSRDDISPLPTARSPRNTGFGRRDQRIWIRSFFSSPVMGYHEGLFLRSGMGPKMESSALANWKKGGHFRELSTKIVMDDAESKSGEKTAPSRQKEDPERPKTIDDFQHEEIVGPTVERDLSDTADKIRASLGELVTFMDALKVGFRALGSVQLLAAIWSASHHNAELIQVLSQDLHFVVSFTIAQLLRFFGSAVQFFLRTEERGRMSMMTLSLQVSKMLVLFFYRSSFVVKVVACGSAVALVGDILLSHSSL